VLIVGTLVQPYLSQRKNQVCFLGLEADSVKVAHREVDHSAMNPPPMRMKRDPFGQNPEEDE
jgi:hypothetical protein